MHDSTVALSFQAAPKTDPGVVICLTAKLDTTLPAGQQITIEHPRSVMWALCRI